MCAENDECTAWSEPKSQRTNRIPKFARKTIRISETASPRIASFETTTASQLTVASRCRLKTAIVWKGKTSATNSDRGIT
jgi:hypothetical protein